MITKKHKKLHFITKVFGGLAFLSVFLFNTLSSIEVKVSSNKTATSQLSLSGKEAKAIDIGEWWDRKDYDCVQVPCYSLGVHTHNAYQAQFCGAGQGSVAHSWDCGFGC